MDRNFEKYKKPPPLKGTEAKCLTAVPPLLEALQLPTRQVRAETFGRYPAPCNGGDTGGAYSLNHFTFRATTRESIRRLTRHQASTSPDSLFRAIPAPTRFGHRHCAIPLPTIYQWLFHMSNADPRRSQIADRRSQTVHDLPPAITCRRPRPAARELAPAAYGPRTAARDLQSANNCLPPTGPSSSLMR
ncbi:hypothetical protein BH20CHL4_BH20CHL4_15920 [soil metagenome]